MGQPRGWTAVVDDDGEVGVVPIDPDLSPSDAAEPSPTHRPVRQPRPRRRRHRASADILAAIAAGAALGGPARYEVAQLVHVAQDGFPWATFWTNISGSFLLGLVLVLVIERFPPTRYVRPFFATGFLGAYTTFSTFAVETDLLVKSGHVVTAALYASASLAAGVIAAWTGILVARLLPPSDRRA
ncbi:MAG: fluoride efflux transporter CrcB [Acidimicrobiales bacterium]